MAKQYQIPGGPYVNVAEDGLEYQLPGYGYLNQADEQEAGEIAAELAVTEANDSVASSATLEIAAAVSVTEDGDGVAAAATLAIAAALAVTEEGDTLSATAEGDDEIGAELSITEGADSLAADASLRITADASIAEAGDALTARIGEDEPEPEEPAQAWEIDFYGALTADANLIALVGEEIYPVVSIGAAVPPYVVYGRSGTDRRYSLDGFDTTLEKVLAEVLCCAETVDSAAALARALIEAVPTTGWPLHRTGHENQDLGLDPATRLYRRRVTLSIFHRTS